VLEKAAAMIAVTRENALLVMTRTRRTRRILALSIHP
jgi:hypothetical protein